MGSDFKRGDFASGFGYEFAKKLQEVCPNGSRRFSQVFDDFCAVGALTIYQGVRTLLTGKQDPEVEAQYMEVVGRYESKRCIFFSEAFSILVQGLEASMYLGEKQVDASDTGRPRTLDFLGNVYEASGCSNPHSGQFFTPWPICEFMARLNLGTPERNPAKRLTIQEPACGAGAMLLAAGEILRGQEFGPRDWWFQAQDVDQRCFYMAYIQLSLTGAPGVVLLGNTLSSDPPRAVWPTPTAALFPYRRPREESNVANLPPTHAAEPDATEAAAIALATGTVELVLEAAEPPEGYNEPPKPEKARGQARRTPREASAPEPGDQLSLF